MKLTDKQKKTLMIAGAVLGIIHYAPSIVSSVRERSAAYRAAHEKPSPVPAPVRASSAPPPPVVAPAPVVPTQEEMQAAQLAASVGIWGGVVPRPNLGPCQIKIELKPSTDTTSPYLAYSTLSCARLEPFRPGQRSNVGLANEAMLDAVPVNAILSGRVINGSIELLQNQAIGYTREGCNITEITLTPFAEHLGATWHEGTKDWVKDPNAPDKCGGGQVMLSRAKTF